MPVLPKEILRPGVYYTKDGPVEFTAADLVELCRQTNALISSGRAVPAPLEHQPTALPMSVEERMANRVLHNAGWLERVYVMGSRLWGDLDICNPEAAKNLPGIRYVSPEIRSEWEVDGKKWSNVITHVALTTRPVHRDQDPFPAPYMSEDGTPRAVPFASMSVSDMPSVRLSLDDAAGDDWLVRSYRVPQGGIWFRGRHYGEGSIPKAEVASAEPQELLQLLRQLSARQRRVAPRAYARLTPSESGSMLPEGAHDVPAASVVTGSIKPLFTGHPEGEPALVWVDPGDGTTHLVSGSVPPEGTASVIALAAPDRDSARGEAAGYLGSRAPVDVRDLACCFRHCGGKYEDFPGLPPEDVELARAASTAPAESFEGFLGGRLTPAEAAAIGGLRLSLEDDLMASFMADLDKEDKEEDKVDKAEEKAEKAEDKAEGDEEKAEEAAEAGPSPADAELKDAVKLLRDLNVDLRDDDIQSPKDLVHHLVIALHAIKKVAGDEEAADMDKEALEPVSQSSAATMPAPTQMSVREDPRVKALLDMGTKAEFEKICATVIEPLVAQGRCTKAVADQLKEKISTHRLSLFDENVPAALVEARAQIWAFRQVPEGTYVAAPAAAAAPVQLSVPDNALERVVNPTPSAAPSADGEPSPERLKEIKDTLWSNMSIRLTPDR